jgi:hypothetical protein
VTGPPGAAVAEALDRIGGDLRLAARRAVIDAYAGRPLDLSVVFAASDVLCRMAARGRDHLHVLAAPRRVTLTRWCREHGIAPRTARRWAAAGHLPTARRESNHWTVQADQAPPTWSTS